MRRKDSTHTASWIFVGLLYIVDLAGILSNATHIEGIKLFKLHAKLYSNLDGFPLG